MNNFKPGGFRHRKDDIGGRPRSDADYSTKKRFDKGSRPEARGNRGGDRYENRGPKEMQLFAAKCTTCGKSCEVPFKPDGTKPVLCRDCFAQKNSVSSNGNSFERKDRSFSDRKPERSFDTPRPQSVPSVTKADLVQVTDRLTKIETMVSELLETVTRNHALHTAQEAAPVAELPAPKKTKATVAKKVVTKKAVAKKVAIKKTVKKVAKK
jgi:CxxC-x17-CxxC domain-containing protein